MARIPSFLLLALALAFLGAILTYASVPPVPEPTCVGGWNIHGEYVPKEQGGCCSGTECCKYAAFRDNPLCGSTPAPQETCSGTDCCKYDKYKNTPLCVVSDTPAAEHECSGLDCCQYEEYENTPLCVAEPTPDEDECAGARPECPVGGWAGGKAPMLLDPDIASGSKCRGACGPDCPDTCVKVKDQKICISDSKGKCFYTCTYHNVLSCGISDGCEVHDDCYDACAAEGEKRMCLPWFGTCHCACDLGCVFKYGLTCLDWMNGKGPMERHELYSSPPLRSEPMKYCPSDSTYQSG
jgi:hypothetical protein